MSTKTMYYPSNIIGSLIVNAETGIPYKNCRVGSIEEQQFFRVIDSTGYCNSNGVKTFGNSISNKLFYDNYNQYIKHRVNYSDEN
jgi:hypothetical protein